MARVSSTKTRQFIYVVGAGLEEEFNPEHIELYMEDGSPLNIDATDRMRWRSEWSEDAVYLRNDVVIDDDKLYILIVNEYGPVDFAPGEDPEFWELVMEGSIEGALIWRGTWSAAQYYNVNDVVSYTGSTYRRKVAGMTAGNPAADAANWELLGGGGTAGALIWKGPWVAATAYAVNDTVTFEGSIYRRKVAGTTAETPKADATNWEIIGSGAFVPIDPWHIVGVAGEPAFQNGWLADPGTVVRFKKLPDGKVRLSGRMDTGNLGTTAFTLPVGYRPTQEAVFPAASYKSGVGNVAAEIRVNTDGRVQAYQGDAVVPPGAYISLDGAEFDTETVTAMGAVAAQQLDPWHTVGAAGEPAFGAGYSSAGGVNPPVAFRKDPTGKVQFRGVVNGNAQGVMFTLPVGYRPAGGFQRFVGIDLSVAANPNGCQLYVNSDGTVNKTASSGGVDITPIEFDTDTVTSYPAATIGPPLVEVLPATPFNGQEVYFQTAAMALKGVRWHLVYREAAVGAYKWEFVGGSEILDETMLAQTINTAVYVNLNSSILLPLGGDYDVSIYTGGMGMEGVSGSIGYISYKIGAAAAADADAAIMRSEAAATNAFTSINAMRRKLAIPANTTLQVQGKSSPAGVFYANNGGAAPLGIRAKPVRVGPA